MAIVPVAPRSRTAIRSPSKAPAFTASVEVAGILLELGDATREDGREVPLGRDERAHVPPAAPLAPVAPVAPPKPSEASSADR